MSFNLDKFMRKGRHVAIPKSLLYNRFVLYAVFALALLNLFFKMVGGDYLFCALFLLVGFITSFFCKNMTVILVITLAVANIIRVFVRGGEFEGMEDKTASTEDKTATDKPHDETTDSTATADHKGDKKDSEKTQMVDELKDQAQELMDAQKNIIDGFEKIDPHMSRAEELIKKIDKTAKQIDGMTVSRLDKAK